MDRESYQLHRAAIAQLQPAPADSIDHVDLPLIVGALANAAAAAMRFGDYDAADAALAEAHWLQRMVSRYHGLCERGGERGRFERFCEDELRMTVGFAD